MITAQCPGCGESVSVDDRLAGCPIRCRYCRHEFTIPESVSIDEERPARRSRWTEEPLERPRRRSRTGRTVLLTCSLIAGGFMLACCGISTAIYFLFIHEIEETVTATDRSMVVTAERLNEFAPGLKPDPSRGNLRRVRHLDGSRDLSYEYESEDGAEKSLYVNHQIGVERSAQDAVSAYNGLGIGANIGLRLGGTGKVQQIERNDLWRWGDDSRCVLLMNGGNKVGNLFMARKGKRYFTLMIAGVYFEDRQAIQELLGPMLQRLDSYEP